MNYHIIGNKENIIVENIDQRGETRNYIWTTEKNNWFLVKTNNYYVIHFIDSEGDGILIIEDNNIYDYIVKKMLQHKLKVMSQFEYIVRKTLNLIKKNSDHF